jgi:hypothetical protein
VNRRARLCQNILADAGIPKVEVRWEWGLKGENGKGLHAPWEYERGPKITCRKQRGQGFWMIWVEEARGLGVGGASGFRFFPGKGPGKGGFDENI